MVVDIFPLLMIMFIASVANAALLKHCRSCDPIAVFFSFAIIIVIIAFALANNMQLFAVLGVAAILGLMAYYATGEEESPDQSQ
jgi:hydrogenase/urease accessory protein HupE